jgi:heat shock protein HslJ
MKGIYARLAGSLLSGLGLIVLTLSANGISQAAPLNASDLPEGMAGVTWELNDLQVTPSRISHPLQAGIVMTIEFDGQGNLSGEGACNGYFAGYTVGPGQAISIGPIGSTQKACPEDIMNLDSDYFVTLQRVNKYTLFQGHLSLTTDNGNGVLNYISSTPPTSPGMPTTGSGTQTLLVLAGLTVGLSLVTGGIAVSRRGRRYSAIRIRTRE